MCEKCIRNIELEKNPASLDTALRLAAYLNVNVEDIFQLDDDSSSDTGSSVYFLHDDLVFANSR